MTYTLSAGLTGEIEIETSDLNDIIEEGCREYIDGHDFDEHINIESKAQDLLDQYDGMDSPCGLGQSFEKAVWWAMSRRDVAPEDVVRKIVREEVRTPSEEGVTLHEKYQEEIKRLVREELRSILGKTIDAYLGKDEDASTT